MALYLDHIIIIVVFTDIIDIAGQDLMKNVNNVNKKCLYRRNCNVLKEMSYHLKHTELK